MKRTKPADLGAVDVVIFDLDGTLVDSREDITRAINQGIVSVGGRTCSGKDVFSLIGRPLVEIFVELLPGELQSKAEQAADVYRRFFFDHCVENSRLYPGVSECLEGLRGLPLAIATTKMTFMAERVVERMGIAHYFDLVQGSDGLPCKPDPAVLSLVVDRLGKRPSRSWIVGDTAYDILAGKAIGIHTCAVTYGIGSVRALKEAAPDLLLDTLADLPAKLVG